MSMHPKRLRINQINSKIAELNEKREAIIKECKHEKYRIANYSWRIGVIDVVRMCSICDEHLGFTSEKEFEQFREEEKKGGEFTVYENVPPKPRLNQWDLMAPDADEN